MALGRLWAGRIYGTNVGNVFVNVEGEDTALAGTLRLNDPTVGLVLYSITGSFDGSKVLFAGSPLSTIEGVAFGTLQAKAILNPKGELEGQWETEVGSAGTFILYPHDQPAGIGGDEAPPDQLHTARYDFGAMEIDRERLTALAEEIQKDFKKAKVVVTVIIGTEQSRFLEDFKKFSFTSETASLIKLFVQEPEGGTNRMVTVELGPKVNFVMTQSKDEAWVLGKLEKLKTELKLFERFYATNFKRIGFGINQVFLLSAIIYLPSLATLSDRAILMTGILFLGFCVSWLHRRYLPFAAIYLNKKPTGVASRIAPSVYSWLIATSAGAAAALLAAVLQGWIGPFGP